MHDDSAEMGGPEYQPLDSGAMTPQRRARNDAIARLARREHSRRELHDYLKERDYLRAVSDDELAQRQAAGEEGAQAALSRDEVELLIEEVLERMAEEGLQSDERFAASFLRTRVLRGQGPRRIQQELRQRGIDSETLNAVMRAASDPTPDAFGHVEAVDFFELARDTLARRFTGPGEGHKERARRERFLLQRGFDYEQLRYAMESAWSDEGEEG